MDDNNQNINMYIKVKIRIIEEDYVSSPSSSSEVIVNTSELIDFFDDTCID